MRIPTMLFAIVLSSFRETLTRSTRLYQGLVYDVMLLIFWNYSFRFDTFVNQMPGVQR